ncbi:MAG: hypothetical protein CMI54_07315 [Parcubacteria group bacterium]|nr:hypothetical protein [Parcubacteria group bacterium]|tara:strand:- start:3371 stop:3568 length:198 start_codon:yes stop_codon:yes gene_type:complete
MSKNSIVLLSEGEEIPEEVKSYAEIIGFVKEDGSLTISFNKFEGPDEFENMNKFFKYVGKIKNNV